MTESNRKRATPLKRMVRGGLSKSIEPTVDWPFVTPWTVAYQAPPSVGFSRQEYWSGVPFPSPGDLPDPGIEPKSPGLQADALPSEPQGKPLIVDYQERQSHLKMREGEKPVRTKAWRLEGVQQVQRREETPRV